MSLFRILVEFSLALVYIPRKCTESGNFFTHALLPTQNAPQVLIILPKSKGNYSLSQAALIWKSVSLKSRKGWRKLICIIKIQSANIKMTWNITLFIFCVICNFLMAWHFCKKYLSYSMILILLLLLCNHGNLILKLHQKKLAT